MNLHPIERDAFRWSWATAASVGLHGAVAGAFIVETLFSPKVPDAPPAAAMVIDVALVPASPPTPPRETPPGPEQQETKPVERVREPEKLPPIPPVPMPVRAEVTLPKPVERPQPQREQQMVERTTAPTSTPAPPAPEAAAPTVGRPSNLPSNASQAWEGLVLAALERGKRYPAEAQRARQEDTVRVRITMDRRGNVQNAQIVRSRGYSALDGEVLSLVRRASPLPAPPSEVTGDPVVRVVPVEFFVRRGRR